MILLTWLQGIHWIPLSKISESEAERDVIGIDMDNAWDFMAKFNGWENVELIIHNEAIPPPQKKTG